MRVIDGPNLVRAMLLAAAFLFSLTAQSQTLTVAGGETIRANNSEHEAYRLEINFPWKPELWKNDNWALSLNHALSVARFEDKNTVNAITWAPNLILTRARKSSVYPYLQFGFGVAYLSDDKFESKNPLYEGHKVSQMGSHGQFETSLALGLRKNAFGIRVKIYHYSNANLAKPNQGIDAAEFGISYSF